MRSEGYPKRKTGQLQKLIRSTRWEMKAVCESGDVHAWELLEHLYLWQASAVPKHQRNDLLPHRVT